MSYIGDFALGSTFDLKFTTRRFSTGAPYTLAGTPSVAAYPDNSTTEITAGITLTVDFDTRTGLNNVRVVATSGNGYATATNYQLVITAGTVDSVSVVGEVIGQFSIEARSGLRPTTAGRTLDVSSTGEAGVDWANVGSPTTTVNLSGTTVKTATDVETDTADIQTRLPAALVSGRMDSSVGAMASGVLTATAIAASALDGKGNWNIGKTGYSLTAITGLGNQTADITGSLSGSVGSVTGAVGSVTGLTASNLDVAVSTRLASASYTAPPSVSTFLTTQITEAYRANGAAPTMAQFISEVLAHLGEASISGTTKTINKFDHSTAAETFTLDDASNPSSITRAT